MNWKERLKETIGSDTMLDVDNTDWKVLVKFISQLLKEQREKMISDVFISLDNYWVWQQMDLQVKNLLTEAINIGLNAPEPNKEGEVK